MNAPSGGGGWRGGKQPASSRASTSASQSSRGWKTEKKSGTGRRTQNSKKASQLFGVFCTLAVLLAIAIWIFWPSYQVHTHFVLLDPLEDNLRFPYGAKLEFPPSNADEVGRMATGKHSVTKVSTMNFLTEQDLETKESPFRSADVCILFYRAATFPNKDGEHLVLLENSTADPQLPNQHEPLKSLKERLLLLPEKQKIILLVDVNSIDSDWRSGLFGDSLHDTISGWTEDLPNLTAILSCDVGEKSWSTGFPGWGGSVFEMMVEEALSEKADTPIQGRSTGNNELTLQEFYDYLARETNSWVQTFRSQQGQHVQIYPSIEKAPLNKDGTSLVIMKSLPTPPERTPDINAAKDLARQLPPLWQKAAKLATENNSLSVPILLDAAQQQLTSAEINLTRGRHQETQILIANSQENFAAAEQLIEDNRSRTDVVLSERDKLLEHTEIRDWISVSRLNATDNSKLPVESPSVILAESLDAFPFSRVGYQAPSQSVRESLLNARKRFEKTAALMFHDAPQFRQLLSKFQRDLLVIEDSLFSNPEQLQELSGLPDRSTTIYLIEQTAEQIEEYVLLKLRIDQFKSKISQQLPEAVAWAATYRDSSFGPELLASLRGNEPFPQPPRTTPIEELQISIANSLLSTRELFAVYQKQTSQTFEDRSQIEQSIKELKSHHDICVKTWETTVQLMDQMETTLPSSPVDRWQLSHNALNLPIFSESIRSSLIESSRFPWKDGTSTERTDKPSSTSSSNNLIAFRDQIVWELAWRLRLQEIIQYTQEETGNETNSDLQNMWDTWSNLGNANTADVVNRKLSELGTLIRSNWQTRRNQISNAKSYSGDSLSEYFRRLKLAHSASYFLRSDDLDLWRTHQEIHAALERVQQLNYSLLLADLAIDSQWTHPSDKPVPDREKWFIQTAQSWLSLADELTSQDTSLVAFRSDIASRHDKLATVERWVDNVVLKLPAQVDFDEQNQDVNLKLDCQLLGLIPTFGVPTFSLISAEAGADGVAILEVLQNGSPLDFKQSEFSRNQVVRRKVIPSKDNCSVIKLTPQLFFRGRTIHRSASLVNPCPASQRTWQYLAGRESAEIRVKGNDNRPIVFVIDWSHSMNAKGEDDLPKQRHLAAVNAVERIVEDMADTMRVGLVIFGHSSKRDANGNILMNDQFKAAFPQFRNAAAKDPLEDVDIIHPIGLLKTDRNDINKKLNALKTVEPYSTTPLGLAVTTAAQELSRQSNTGGIIVAITDGAPTDLGDPIKNLPPNPSKRDIENVKDLYARRFAGLERALKPVDISAVIFALDFQQQDLTTLHCIFGDGPPQGALGACEFMGTNEPLHLPIVSASGEGDPAGTRLRKEIDSQIEPRNFQIKLANGEPVASEKLKDATIVVKPNETYQVQFGDILLDQLPLRSGDTLSLEMNWSKNRFDVKRPFRTHRAASVQQTVPESSDIPNVLRVNKIRTPTISSNTEMYETLEIDIMLDHEKDFRPVTKPEEITFSISAVGDASFQPDAVIQEFSSKFGAPGWNLKISPWPRNRILNIDSFWKMQTTIPDVLLKLEDLDTATSREDALVVGGAAQNLPAMRVWKKQQANSGQLVYEIRAEPVNRDDFALLTQMTVEIGGTNILNENKAFQPDHVSHLKTIVDSGVVVLAFEYPEDVKTLENKVIAITSFSSRQRDALQLSKPVRVLD